MSKNDLPSATNAGLTLLVAVVLYHVSQLIYNLYIHPLSKVPGPVTWSVSRIPFIHALLRGTIVQDIQQLHRRYGPVLRIAPDEVTFSQPQAWNDILGHKKDHAEFLKDSTWWRRQPGQPNSLISAIEPETHARIRKVLAPAFTPTALVSQEGHLHRYVDLLVERLREAVQASPGANAEVDMMPWFNFVAFDIFGDLGFGESFDCLQHSKYHPWISLLFNSVKAASYVAAARFYPAVEFVLLKLIPASLKKTANDHFQQIVDKVNRRLSWDTERPDLMSHVVKGIDQPNGLTMDEVNATFMALTTAGSETTATALSGTMNYLIQNPAKMEKLKAEIRQAFHAWEDITLEAVKGLSYLDAVLSEGLRLCPPIPWILPRKVPAGGQTVCGTWLPGGTSVSIQAYALNRDPTYFESPNDFLPERWLHSLDKNPMTSSRPKLPNINPFSIGNRSCLGRHLAMAEMRLIMVKLLWTFDMEAVPSKTLHWEDLKTFLLVEKKPVYVRIRLRDGAQEKAAHIEA